MAKVVRIKKIAASRVATPPTRQDPLLTAARSAGLRYVNDTDPGIRRVSAGKEFRYIGPDGRRIRDPATRARIKRLAVPPAWTGVWICPHADGHIQATGRDARRRKQYRYHSDWHAVRDENKYERMIAFGQALPRIRKRLARDMARPGLGREKVLATMVRLLETTLVRVGNEEYARANGSIGLSTMRDRHVRFKPGGTLQFDFKGKSGVRHSINLKDPRLADIVRRTQDLPGQELFQYIDENGTQQRISSDDVNNYLRTIAGAEFSAKDFRTWAGTVLAALALRQFARFDTKAQARKNLVAAVERVAERLGNTPSVCRKCYIHPVVLHSYLEGATVDVIVKKSADTLNHTLAALTGTEGAVLAFLLAQLKRNRQPPLLTSLRRSVATARRARPRRHGARDTSGDARAAARSRTRRRQPSGHPPRPI